MAYLAICIGYYLTFYVAGQLPDGSIALSSCCITFSSTFINYCLSFTYDFSADDMLPEISLVDLIATIAELIGTFITFDYLLTTACFYYR